MIRSLRQSDRQMVIALGILLPGAFAVGIVARKPAPLVSEFPAALAAAPHLFENIEWRRVDLFKNSPIKVSLLCEHRGAGAFAFAFSAAEDFAQPDLLVYWISGTSNFTNALPENAQLLGILIHFPTWSCPSKPPPRPVCCCYTASPTTKSWMCPSQSASMLQPRNSLGNS